MPQCCRRRKHQTQTAMNTDLRIKICLWNQVQPLSENVNLVWILRLPEVSWRKLSEKAENWANKWTNSSIKSSSLASLLGWLRLVLCFEYNKHPSVAYVRLSVGRNEEREGTQKEIIEQIIRQLNSNKAWPDKIYRFNHLSLLKGQALSPPLSQN